MLVLHYCTFGGVHISYLHLYVSTKYRSMILSVYNSVEVTFFFLCCCRVTLNIIFICLLRVQMFNNKHKKSNNNIISSKNYMVNGDQPLFRFTSFIDTIPTRTTNSHKIITSMVKRYPYSEPSTTDTGHSSFTITRFYSKGLQHFF